MHIFWIVKFWPRYISRQRPYEVPDLGPFGSAISTRFEFTTILYSVFRMKGKNEGKESYEKEEKNEEIEKMLITGKKGLFTEEKR